jgi:ribonuclease Z
MRIILQTEFPNGHFGDPALYVRDISGKAALLFDCGDLTRFSTKKLLKVTHIFLSHCHVDHFFGFDLFLRVHIGTVKTIHVLGPPETSERVAGKLRGYTWNLIREQNLEFVVTDIDHARSEMHTVRFHSRDQFQPTGAVKAKWNTHSPVFDAGAYQVSCVELDHRTPSLAYAVEERPAVRILKDALDERELVPGPWIQDLKNWFIFGGHADAMILVTTKKGGLKKFRASQLSKWLLIPEHRHKIAYVTDGAASARNWQVLLPLVQGADLLFHETCFLEEDQELADETKHFTTRFVGELATAAKVGQLVPFHFSKRYLDRPEEVLRELSSHFSGSLVRL